MFRHKGWNFEAQHLIKIFWWTELLKESGTGQGQKETNLTVYILIYAYDMLDCSQVSSINRQEQYFFQRPRIHYCHSANGKSIAQVKLAIRR